MLNTSKLKTLMLCATCALVIGCTTPSAPSTTAASAPDIKKVTAVDPGQFVGKWEGEYQSGVTQRRGAVVFELNKAAGVARGQFIITTYVPTTETRTSVPSHKTMGPKRKTTQITSTSRTDAPLSIDFMGVEGNKVKGEVTPYFDPKFNSTVYSTYEGILEGNRIQGTYTSRIGQSGSSYTGTWWAIRK